MIEIEDQAKAFVLQTFNSPEELDNTIEPFLSTSYKKANFFLRVVMTEGSEDFKTKMFHSNVVTKFIKENWLKLHSDIIGKKEFFVDKVYEDDYSIFLIDIFIWKSGVRWPFRTLNNYDEYLNLGKRIIFYDVDYKWREINHDGNIKDYIGWTPEDELKLYLVKLALES